MRRLAVVAAVVLASGCSAPAASPPVTPSGPASTGASSSGSPGPARPAPSHLVVRTLPWRLPFPVAREAMVRQGGLLEVAGGLVEGDRSTDRAFTLDPATGRSRPAPALLVPVHDTAGVRLAGRMLVIGGGNATEQSVVQRRTPSGWSATGHLPQARSDLTAVRAGGRVLVLGGYDATTAAVPSVVASRDGVHWRRVGTLPVPVRYAASVVLGHAVWLFGGERSGAMQRAVQRVDARGRARVVARLPEALGHAAAARLGGRVLIVGGRLTQDTVTDRMWWFDPATRQFSPAGHLSTPLADSAVATDGDVVYLVGGESPSVTDRVVRLTLR